MRRFLLLLPAAAIALSGCFMDGPTYIPVADAANNTCVNRGGVRALDAEAYIVTCEDGIAREFTNKVK